MAPMYARSAQRRTWLLAACALFLTLPCTWGPSFAMQGGLSRKQRRGTLHNKDRLPTLYELPLDEPEAEPEPKEVMPEQRLPYTMNVVAQFDDGSNPNMKYVEKKITAALANNENMIRHVDVWVYREGNHHREKSGRVHSRPNGEEAMLAQEEDLDVLATKKKPGRNKGASMTPFAVKVKVDLLNHGHHTLLLSNPEKHAQASLTEAVDHAADILKKKLREERDKDIRLWRKRDKERKSESIVEDAMVSDTELDVFDAGEVIEQLADRQAERLYQAVEAAAEKEAAQQAAQEVGKAAEKSTPAVAREAPKPAAKQEEHKSEEVLEDFAAAMRKVLGL